MAIRAAKAKKGALVYFFGDGRADGDGKMKPLLGGKGANLAEMTRIGLPVPPGFTITTEVCTWFNAHGKTLPKELDQQVNDAIVRIEKSLGKGFGSLTNPLLFAVRSGARDSMPGMMDTILNLGLNDETVSGSRRRQRQRAFRLRLLPPLHPDVRRRRHGRADAPRRTSRAV